MKHIELKQVDGGKLLVCNHPKVSRIWQYGYSDANPKSPVKDFIGLQVGDETISFEEDGTGKAIQDAEKFLSELK